MENTYTLFYQKPYLCAMSCLQMILFRHTGKVYDQESLAVVFGVKIDPTLGHIYTNTYESLTKQNFDEGVSTMDLTNLLSRFFESESIELSAKSHPASKWKTYKNF